MFLHERHTLCFRPRCFVQLSSRFCSSHLQHSFPVHPTVVGEIGTSRERDRAATAATSQRNIAFAAVRAYAQWRQNSRHTCNHSESFLTRRGKTSVDVMQLILASSVELPKCCPKFEKKNTKCYYVRLEIVHGHLESLMVTPAQHYIAECQPGFAEHMFYRISKPMSCVCQLVVISFGKHKLTIDWGGSVIIAGND